MKLMRSKTKQPKISKYATKRIFSNLQESIKNNNN